MRRLRLLSLVMAFALLPTVGSAGMVKVTIPDGTDIRLLLVERLSSATAEEDQKVRFEVAEDIVVKGFKVIAAGAQGWGTVIETQPKKSFGRSGKLNFTISYVKAVDGQNVRIRTEKKRQGSNDHVKAGVLTYFTGLGGFFIKGKDISIPAGTEYTIYVDGDRHLEIDTALAASNGNGSR